MKKLVYSNYIEKGYGYVVDKTRQTSSVDLHNHDFFEIELILESKNAVHVLNGKKRRIECGSIYIINPSDIHSYELPGNGYFDRYNVRFKQDAISENILTSVINSHCRCVLKDGDLKSAIKLFEIIAHYYNSNKSATNTAQEISKRIIESLILLIRDRSSAEFGEEANQKSQIQRILLYLHKNFKSEITLEEIAAYSNFSPHYASQLFHAATSCTITQYVTNLRLDYAKKLLFSTDHSIGEICVKCGFKSFAHFLRCFKTAYGTSPSKYRQIIRSENRSQRSLK
jgi:AraC-like DNA-binding protein